MKKNLAISMLLSLLFWGLNAQNPNEGKTPIQTFKKLVKVIKARDLAAYKLLWAEEQLEKEGMYSNLQSDPKEWDELNRIFKGPQKFTKPGTFKERDGEPHFKTKIIAPKAEGGGIGNISMVQREGKWLMYSW